MLFWIFKIILEYNWFKRYIYIFFIFILGIFDILVEEEELNLENEDDFVDIDMVVL